MKNTIAKVLATAAALFVPAAAQSALYVFEGTMTAAQEVQNPKVVSPAIGSFHAIYDDAANVFIYISIAGKGLVGGTLTGLHIHGVGAAGGPAGSNSGIALGLAHATVVTTAGGAFYFNATNQGGLPPGADTQATFSQTEEGHLLGGRSYINLHNTTYPSGEIRGQIAAVPEPETYALMLAGLGLVGWVAARRRKVGV